MGDHDLEQGLQEALRLGQFPDGEEDIKEALKESRSLLRMRSWSARLFGVPAFGFAVIVALSLWAIPGFVPFLEAQVTQHRLPLRHQLRRGRGHRGPPDRPHSRSA